MLCYINTHLMGNGLNKSPRTHYVKSIFIPQIRDWTNQHWSLLCQINIHLASMRLISSPWTFIVSNVYSPHKYGIELITMDLYCVKSRLIPQVRVWLNHHRPLLCQIEILNWSLRGVISLHHASARDFSMSVQSGFAKKWTSIQGASG